MAFMEGKLQPIDLLGAWQSRQQREAIDYENQKKSNLLAEQMAREQLRSMKNKNEMDELNKNALVSAMSMPVTAQDSPYASGLREAAIRGHADKFLGMMGYKVPEQGGVSGIGGGRERIPTEKTSNSNAGENSIIYTGSGNDSVAEIMAQKAARTQAIQDALKAESSANPTISNVVSDTVNGVKTIGSVVRPDTTKEDMAAQRERDLAQFKNQLDIQKNAANKPPTASKANLDEKKYITDTADVDEYFGSRDWSDNVKSNYRGWKRKWYEDHKDDPNGVDWDMFFNNLANENDKSQSKK